MWEEEMLELGFAVRTKEGVFEYTHPERIINIDGTFLTLDEATQPGWSGRPVSVFYDPTGARTGRAANKASITCTGLFGSTATGFALPPHFQVKSTGIIGCKSPCPLEICWANHGRNFLSTHVGKKHSWIDHSGGAL
jgi:hypothetical protein